MPGLVLVDGFVASSPVSESGPAVFFDLRVLSKE